MSLDVRVAADGVRSPVAAERLAELARGVLRAEGVREAVLSVALVSDRAMAALNRRHLGHRGPTDVISFAFERRRDGAPVVGDIYVAPGVARENARRHGSGVRQEVARLVVHGTLHVLGYDHPDGDGREACAMWRRQERLLRRLYDGAGRERGP